MLLLTFLCNFLECISQEICPRAENLIIVEPWCSGYHYCTTLFSKTSTQVMRRFKSRLRRVGELQCWESLTVVPAGNKAWRLSPVNHSAKTIYDSSSSIFSLSSQEGEYRLQFKKEPTTCYAFLNPTFLWSVKQKYCISKRITVN